MAQPASWDRGSVRGTTARYLQLSGTRAKYVGPGTDDRDAAAVRTDHPIPANCPLYYFEIEILSAGRDGFIGVGLTTRDVNMDRLPGWEPHSYGYHGDDGHIFSGRGTGHAYGPTFSTGDWLGVILNRVERTISFTKKGYDLGVAFEGVSEEVLYPAVGFRTPGEEIEANFGLNLVGKPYRGDVEAIKQEAINKLHSHILSVKLPGQRSNIVGELIFDYLKQNGYWQTAIAVGNDVLDGRKQVSKEDMHQAEVQLSIRALLRDGEVDRAMAAAETIAPGVFKAQTGILFRLLCQKFCEMIKSGNDEEAMMYGREKLGHSCNSQADTKLLEDALALFAYTDPVSSPSGYLLRTPHRESLADALDKAVLEHRGLKPESSLETTWRQAFLVCHELRAGGNAAAILLPEEVSAILQGLGEPDESSPTP